MEPRDATPGPLTDVHALARALACPLPPSLLDVRWRLGGPPGLDAYRAGHLPGAIFVDLDTDLAAEPGPAGRHPLPEPAAFQAAMRRAGVSDERPVVVYDDMDATVAARAWWLLRYFGHGGEVGVKVEEDRPRLVTGTVGVQAGRAGQPPAHVEQARRNRAGQRPGQGGHVGQQALRAVCRLHQEHLLCPGWRCPGWPEHRARGPTSYRRVSHQVRLVGKSGNSVDEPPNTLASLRMNLWITGAHRCGRAEGAR